MLTDLLLLADALLFLSMGAMLAALPGGTVAALGLPSGQTAFYRRLLGAVLVGVGLALMMSVLPTGLRGLGAHGAIVINLSLALTLAVLLLTGTGRSSRQGKRLPWILVVVLLGLSALESVLI